MSIGEREMRAIEPRAIDPVVAAPGATGASAAARPAGPLVWSDAAHGPDDLGRGPEAAFLAEVLAHGRVETPFCLGVFGAAGSGKSRFVDEMLTVAERLGTTAGGPFVTPVLTARIDADASPPADLLTRGVFAAVAAAYPRLAGDAMHAGADPVRAARDAAEALNEARRRLDTERQSLETLGGREARLTDAVLFEASGSRVDAYARRNRARLERALRLFGFGSADPVAAYKDLVRDAAETDGPLARLGLALRSLWAYRGQTRLLVTAAILGGVAWGASALRSDQGWLTQLRDLGDRATPVADWAQAHLHWLGPIHTAALVLALVCLALDVSRAARFLLPIFRGVSLLRDDVEGRRRDINGLLAHQTRHVDGLASEVESAAKLADEAERRAGAHKAAGLADVRLPGEASDAAGAFFASLGAAVAAAGSNAAAPGRIVVAIDGLDRLDDAAAARLLMEARRLLGAGFVTVVTGDRTALQSGFAETDPALATSRFDRHVQVAYHFGPAEGGEAARSHFARQLIEGRAGEAAPAGIAVDGRTSALDRPWLPREAETVAALAPLAGEGPRAVKHYVNLYRIARADPRLRDAPPPVFTALALALALDKHGFPDDIAALNETSQWEAPRDLTLLRKALATAQAVSGVPVELVQAQRGFDLARHYSARG